MLTGERMRRLRDIGRAAAALIGMSVLVTFAPQVLSYMVIGGSMLVGGSSAAEASIAYLTVHSAVWTGLVYAAMGLPFLIWALVLRARRRRGEDALRLSFSRPKPLAVSLALLVAAAIGFSGVSGVVMELFDLFQPETMDSYRTLVADSGLVRYGLAWAFNLLLVPLVEETAFRGVGMGYLRRAGMPFAAANVLQALAFACFHMNVVQGAYTFILGLVLGYTAQRYRSLVAPIIVHAAFNFVGSLGSEVLAAVAPAWAVPWLTAFALAAAGLSLVGITRVTADR